jgi:hypothetical protein
MIYFIQDTHSRAIKIGISHDPVKRLADLQVAHHSKLLLIGVMDGTRATEESLHSLFTHKRGEWFEPTRDLMTFIRENAVSTSALESVKLTRAKRHNILDDLKPELRGPEFWPSMARLIVCGVYKGNGIEGLVNTVYPVYAASSEKRPDIHSHLSYEEARREIERLIEIQNS